MQRIDNPINAIDDFFVFLLKFGNPGARGREFRLKTRVFGRKFRTRARLGRGPNCIATLCFRCIAFSHFLIPIAARTTH